MTTKLFIDSSQIDTAVVILEVEGKQYKTKSQSRVLKSQMILPLIEDMIIQHNLKLNNLNAIHVITGPGSFTGLRVGITVANTLGFILDIPVNDKKTLAIPTYS